MEENTKKIPHSLMIDDRKKIIMTGITDVGNFDESGITLYTSVDEIIIKGENLQVTVLNTADGQFSAEGKIISVAYSDKKSKNGGFLGKVFR